MKTKKKIKELEQKLNELRTDLNITNNRLRLINKSKEQELTCEGCYHKPHGAKACQECVDFSHKRNSTTCS